MFREATYTCTNSRCGHVFIADLEALHTLSSSTTPNPEINRP